MYSWKSCSISGQIINMEVISCMEQVLATEIINNMQTVVTDVEIALNKARLMIEEIMEITEHEDSEKDVDETLMFAAQRYTLNTQAQIAHDYLIEIQSLIDKIQK